MSASVRWDFWSFHGRWFPRFSQSRFAHFHSPFELSHSHRLSQVKGKLGGVIISIAYTLMFMVVKAFPFTMDWIGPEGIFYIFAANSFLGVLFIYWYLPETLGKSFTEIQSCFTKKIPWIEPDEGIKNVCFLISKLNVSFVIQSAQHDFNKTIKHLFFLLYKINLIIYIIFFLNNYHSLQYITVQKT